MGNLVIAGSIKFNVHKCQKRNPLEVKDFEHLLITIQRNTIKKVRILNADFFIENLYIVSIVL